MYFMGIAGLSHKPSWAACIPAGDIKIIDWLIEWLIDWLINIVFTRLPVSSLEVQGLV